MQISGPYATPAVVFDLGNASGGKLAKPAKESLPKTAPPTAKKIKPKKKAKQ